eukprot:jgi/Botrbrau1/20229/Bobra.31_1s0025.1
MTVRTSGIREGPSSRNRACLSCEPSTRGLHAPLTVRALRAPGGAIPRSKGSYHCRKAKRVTIPQATEVAQTRPQTGDWPALEAQASSYRGVPHLWKELAREHGSKLAVTDPHQKPNIQWTFRDLEQNIVQFAAALQRLGLNQGDKVSLFSENSSRWLVVDQAIMMNGAADAVRGASTPVEELAYIVQQSNSSGLIVQDAATLDKLVPFLTTPESGNNGTALQSYLRFVIVLWGEPSQDASKALGIQIRTFDDVLALGGDTSSFQPAALGEKDLATLVYTSGTTGHPKAVMLSHGNLMYQLNNLDYFLTSTDGDTALSLLPPWHIYERSCGYFILKRHIHMVYTNIRNFRDDLTRYPPAFFVCVPLVLDTLHSRVQQQIKQGSAIKQAIAGFFFTVSQKYIRAKRVVDGVALEYAQTSRPIGALLLAIVTCALLHPLHLLANALVYQKIRAALGIKKIAVSGGGSLAAHLDDFYEIIGLDVVNGWGLTETSPVLCCRRATVPNQNVRGTVGLPIPGTQIRVVDPETREDLPDGIQGLLLAKGPGVMSGYYRDEFATEKVFADGWFDTGDLGWRIPSGLPGSKMGGHVVLTGRAKDTIVLSNGENVEPQPVEDAIQSSPFIKYAMLIGQDHRQLGALIVEDVDAFSDIAASQGELSPADRRAIIQKEIARLTKDRPRFEHVVAFEVVSEPFSVEDGTLTRTMKIRRPAIMAKYSQEISALGHHLR